MPSLFILICEMLGLFIACSIRKVVAKYKPKHEKLNENYGVSNMAWKIVLRFDQLKSLIFSRMYVVQGT